MTGVLGKFLVMGVVLSSIVACSSDDSSKKVAPTGSDTYSCLFAFSEGGQADYSALRTAKNAQTYFEKEYNQNYLDAVSAASAEATMDFVNQTDATVYKSELITTNLCSSNLFATAKDMTLDVEARWNSAKDTVKKGTILGLYLPQVDSKDYPSLKNSAAIIIRENTNRWTLVHEFMHHLFMLRSLEQGYRDDQLRSDLSKVSAEVNAIYPDEDQPLTEAQALKLAIPLAKYTKIADTFLVHYFLEEMTIEATLKDAASAGSLKYVPTGEDNWYIAVSAQKAVDLYAGLAGEIANVAKKLPSNANAEVMALYDAISIIKKRKETIDLIQKRFPYDLSTQGGALLTAKAHEHQGCAHEAEGEEIMKSIEKVIRKTK